MSKLSVEQKSIIALLKDRKSRFLIPDYQRPYAWKEDECSTLWDDLYNFAFPEGDKDRFNESKDEYYLGSIVTFMNSKNPPQHEVIDGQQRITTLLLMLRAFYVVSSEAEDKESRSLSQKIAECIWEADEFGEPDKERLKIESEVATDSDKDEFLDILKSGEAPKKYKSLYAENYRLIVKKIEKFKESRPSYFAYFPNRVLEFCVILSVVAEDHDSALRIFTTLNDRGLPLSDADIFKAELYKYYKEKGEKEGQGEEATSGFIERWKKLEEKAKDAFPKAKNHMDELFTRYMYYQRAKIDKTSSNSVEALRTFYARKNGGKQSYYILKRDETLYDLESLAEFWLAVEKQDSPRFSDSTLELLYVLNYAPNGMWALLVSVYFMHWRDGEGMLEEGPFDRLLQMITAFVWAYTFEKSGVNNLRTPLFREMVRIIDGEEVDFSEYRFDRDELREQLKSYEFTYAKDITRSMLTWWAFYRFKSQKLLKPLGQKFQIEHIYAKQRAKKEDQPISVESLGNKILLEPSINIPASDYRFSDKKKYYEGEWGRKRKERTEIAELIELADSHDDFQEKDIKQREDAIIDGFLDFLGECGLLKEKSTGRA